MTLFLLHWEQTRHPSCAQLSVMSMSVSSRTLSRRPKPNSWHCRLSRLVECRYNVRKQLAQPYSDCGKSNFPIVDVQGLSSVYSALVVDCNIPKFVQRWVYNRPNLLPTVEKVIFWQWMYKVYLVSIQPR